MSTRPKIEHITSPAESHSCTEMTAFWEENDDYLSQSLFLAGLDDMIMKVNTQGKIIP